MNTLSRAEIEKLAGVNGHWCVSIYQATHRHVPQPQQQDAVQLKNLLREAEEQLTGLGMRSPDARNLLKPGFDLLDQPLFWQHEGDGLAVLLAPGQSFIYQVPETFRNFVFAGDRFHLKPLLPLWTGNGRFYLLAVSQNTVRFFEGTRLELREIHPELMPKGFADATRFWGKEAHDRFHVKQDRGGERGYISEGQEVAFPSPKDRLAQYFHLIDQGIRPVLQPDNAPLVLAAVEEYFPIYREANTYGNLLDEGIHGSPDRMKDNELHTRAWKIVEPLFHRRRQIAEAEFPMILSKGRASNKLEEIVPAALQGRVATLFVALSQEQWGSVDPDTFQVRTNGKAGPGDQDLLDLAAVQTLSKDGVVYAVEQNKVPGGGNLAAVFRY